MGKCIKRPRTVDSGHPAIFPLESNKKNFPFRVKIIADLLA